jgi:hypothetical protein
MEYLTQRYVPLRALLYVIASLGANIVFLAVPWSHIIDLVSGCESAQPIEGAALGYPLELDRAIDM